MLKIFRQVILPLIGLLIVLRTDLSNGLHEQFLTAPLWQGFDEDDHWYLIYKELMLKWEDDGAGDTGLADPTEKQYNMRSTAKELNLTTLVIEDLNTNQRQLLDLALE